MHICPYCKSKDTRIFKVVGKWIINRCSYCGLVYTLTEDSRSKINNDFYNESYISGYAQRETELKSRFKNYLNIIEKYKKGGKLLDIGCGMGYFINVAQREGKYIWNTTGVEPNNLLINSGAIAIRKRVIRGLLSKLPLKRNSCDCITCFDVLEHDLNLQKNMIEIKRVLRKNGILVVQAPNWVSLMALLTGKQWDWWALPDHVLHMSFSFLINFLNNNDFDILEKFTYERPSDFMLNVKGKFCKNYFTKALFFFLCPLFYILERISWLFNYGALSFIVAKKRQ